MNLFTSHEPFLIKLFWYEIQQNPGNSMVRPMASPSVWVQGQPKEAETSSD